MSHFNLEHFKTSDPHVLTPGCDFEKVRYSDLNYTSRISALLEATRGKGNPINNRDHFNDLLNGRFSLASVIEQTRSEYVQEKAI